MADTSRLRKELHSLGYSGKVSEEIAEFYKESNKRTRRDKVDILAEMLELCRQPCAKKTVMYKTNVSYTLFRAYFKRLRTLKMLELGPNAKQYLTTEKGLEFLKRYSALRELLKSTTESTKKEIKN